MDCKYFRQSPYFKKGNDIIIECHDKEAAVGEDPKTSVIQHHSTELKQSPYFRIKNNIKIEYENTETTVENNLELSPEKNVKRRLETKLTDLADTTDFAENDSKKSKSDTLLRDTNVIKSEVSQPENWEAILKNIRTMRQKQDAPVDHLVAEHLSYKDYPPEVRRFHCLVSLMLSSQTRDQVTFAAMQKLKQHGLTCRNIINTDEAEIAQMICPVGFWKKKASYIKRTAVMLAQQYNEDIPRSVKELCQLPGVGEKVAVLTVNHAWEDAIGIGVDTHVHRITNRLGWTFKGTKTPEKTRQVLEGWLPHSLWSELNMLLVGFGQQQCTPVKPKCSTCLNRQLCPSSKTRSLEKNC